MSCDMSCEEETSSRPDGAGSVAMALRALESPDWPQLTRAVLGRNGTRREVVQRLAAMLDQRAGRDGREKPDGDADTGKRGLTEREREILDMWPRFEDSEPVMPGDKVHYASTHNDETAIEVESITVMDGLFVLCDGECRSNQYEQGQRVKRPVRSVLDADGVEIKVGDTVWHHSGFAHGVVTSIDAGSLMGTVRYVNGGVEFRDAAKDLTHTRPDSWERLEEDAVKGVCAYFGFLNKRCDDGDGCPANKPGDCAKFKVLDIIRRAKKLAGVEEGE